MKNNPISITNVSNLLHYHQVMFTPWKKGVWKLNMIYYGAHGRAKNIPAFCSEDIVKKWLALHFSTENLRNLVERIDN